MYPGIENGSEIYRILVDHLRDGQTDEFAELLPQFISTMPIGNSNRVVDLILASLDQDVGQAQLSENLPELASS
ncbi:hypothetical protein [Ferrimicrobium acidiphilum]|uniref:Uncharacterized protein n=2 Tax=Ferrimicrobium acidiphilum TaxID=121039 RepID=A0A0D8FT48_9ACTN|nr:hypothetical protein [Ferrimicrobium acidiphilum]KJE76286.1 hypothetical protein FEAC_20210 [Ferrimicrobium acidiphilum DSM 19497]